MNTREKIRELIKVNKTKESLEILESIASQVGNNDLSDKVLLLSSRYNATLGANMEGVIASGDYNVELVKINKAIIMLLNDIPNGDLVSSIDDYHEKLQLIKLRLSQYKVDANNKSLQLAKIETKIPFVTDKDSVQLLLDFIQGFNEFISSIPEILKDKGEPDYGYLLQEVDNAKDIFIVNRVFKTIIRFIDRLIWLIDFYLKNPDGTYYEKEIRRILNSGRTNEAIRSKMKNGSIQKLILTDGGSIRVGVKSVDANILFYYTGKGLRALFPRTESEKLDEYKNVKNYSDERLILEHFIGFLPLYSIKDIED